MGISGTARRADRGSVTGRRRWLAFALLAALAVPATANANWNQPVASYLNFSATRSGYAPSITNINGTPYVGWQEYNGTVTQAVVKSLGPNGWTAVGGSLNIDPAKAAGGVEVTNIGGVPYAIWQETDGTHYQIHVALFNGSAWVPVGGSSPINTAGKDGYGGFLAGVNGVPYVAWFEQNGTAYLLYVKYFNGSGWVSAGPTVPLNNDQTKQATGPTIASVGGVPYIVWQEGTNTQHQIFVKRFDGSNWNFVGGSSPLNISASMDASQPSIASVNDVGYVAWVEYDGSGFQQLRVKRFNGTAWVSLASNSLNYDVTKNSGAPNIASVGGAPVLAWQEPGATVSQIRVRRFDGANWYLVGGPLNFDPTQSAFFLDPSVADVGGVPYVTWEENDASSTFRIRVKRLEPDIVSESAVASQTAANLTAQVYDYGVPLTVGFDYGPTAGFGAQTALATTAGNGTTTVTQQVGGLTPNTTYSYRAFGFDGTRETAQGPTQTFATLALAPPPGPPPITVDKISDLGISPSTFAAAPTGPSVIAAAVRKTGAIVSYKSTQPATTTFTVQRPASGRIQGKNCNKPSKRNRKRKQCVRYLDVGSFTHADIAGSNKFRFTGRINGRKLKPGSYRLQAVPRNSAGVGPAVFTPFRVKRR